MNDCIGKFGKTFGHKFESLLIEQNCYHSISNTTGYSIDDIEKLVNLLSYKKFKVVCKRCGQEFKSE